MPAVHAIWRGKTAHLALACFLFAAPVSRWAAGDLALASEGTPALASGERTPVAYSSRADADAKLTTDPDSPFWREAHFVFAEVDKRGETERDYRTEVRSRWTKDNLYFLFISPY